MLGGGEQDIPPELAGWGAGGVQKWRPPASATTRQKEMQKWCLPAPVPRESQQAPVSLADAVRLTSESPKHAI